MEIFSKLGINWKLLLAQAVNFLIVLWLLKRYVFPVIIRFIDERAGRIKAGLEKEEKASQVLASAEDARRLKIKQTHEESSAMLFKAKAEAEKRAAQTTASARETADALLAKASQAASAERAAALAAAKSDIRDVALLVAEKVLRRAVSEKDDATMLGDVEKFITEKNIHA